MTLTLWYCEALVSEKFGFDYWAYFGFDWSQIRRFRLHVRVDIQRYNYIVFSVDEAGGSEVKMERYVVLKSFAKDSKWNN